jgi:hypothetical protein
MRLQMFEIFFLQQLVASPQRLSHLFVFFIVVQLRQYLVLVALDQVFCISQFHTPSPSQRIL